MARETRLPLNRDRVLQEALALADESGVEALTMRKLGERLGFEAMSLYRYVENKKDVLDGMLDVVLSEWQLPDPALPFADAVRTSARSVHDALRRHPWSARLLMTGAHMRPARLQYMDRLLATLRSGGFAPDDAYHVYHLLDGFIFGYTLWEISYTTVPMDTEEVARLMQQVPWHEYPDLADHRDQHMSEGSHRDVSAFEVGLDLMLDGLERRT